MSQTSNHGEHRGRAVVWSSQPESVVGLCGGGEAGAGSQNPVSCARGSRRQEPPFHPCCITPNRIERRSRWTPTAPSEWDGGWAPVTYCQRPLVQIQVWSTGSQPDVAMGSRQNDHAAWKIDAEESRKGHCFVERTNVQGGGVDSPLNRRGWSWQAARTSCHLSCFRQACVLRIRRGMAPVRGAFCPICPSAASSCPPVSQPRGTSALERWGGEMLSCRCPGPHSAYSLPGSTQP